MAVAGVRSPGAYRRFAGAPRARSYTAPIGRLARRRTHPNRAAPRV